MPGGGRDRLAIAIGTVSMSAVASSSAMPDAAIVVPPSTGTRLTTGLMP